MARKTNRACITEKDDFPQNLSALMKEHGLSQQDLASALGIKRQTISLYASGQSSPDIGRLKKIANYFGVSSDWLLGLSEARSNSEDIQKAVSTTGLSEDSVMRLCEIAKGNEKIQFAVHDFLDDLLDNISLMDIAIAYKQFKSGDLSDCYVMAPNGALIDFFDKDLPLLVLQNKFTRFVLDSREKDRFSWKSIRKEQMESAVVDGTLQAGFQEDIERGK